MKQSLRDRLYKYLLRQHGFVASGQLQRLVMEHTTQTPRTCVRRLQEMCEERILERKLIKGHSHYRVKPLQSLYIAPQRTQPQKTTDTTSDLKSAQKRVQLFDQNRPAIEVMA